MCFCFILLHPFDQIELKRINLSYLKLRKRKMNACERGAAFKDGNLGLFKYLRDIVLSDKIKSKCFVSIIPRIGNSI